MVDLSSAERRELVNVIMRSGHVAQSHIAAMRLRHEPADFLITVPMSPVGLFDFHRSEELVGAGRQSAREVLPSLLQALARREPVHRRLRRWIASLRPRDEEPTNERSVSPQD